LIDEEVEMSKDELQATEIELWLAGEIFEAVVREAVEEWRMLWGEGC
jgi:hypothetical protein